MPIITMFLTAGVAFYLRFLVALLKDSKWHLAQSRSRLRFNGKKIVQPIWRKVSEPLAPIPIRELKTNTTLNQSERTAI